MKTFSNVLSGLVGVAALALVGCGDPAHQAHGNGGGGGGHHHASPSGGVAVELGDHQFHLDILSEPATGVIKAWVMDAHAENFVRVPLTNLSLEVVAGGSTQTVVLQAQGSTVTGETVGDTSMFQGQADALKGVAQFTGTIPVITIRDYNFRGVGFEYPDSH
jgi:hypothetical protein